MRLIILIVCSFLLAGCKETLYSGLDERQANEMLAVLSKAGIPTSKKNMGKGVFNIAVQKEKMPIAVSILKDNGLPNDNFASMSEIYKKDGLISSPMEERVRYTFALSQSLSETLTNIDGVNVARVHISVPENDSIGAKKKATSASIFIKHTERFSNENALPDIKRILEMSVEGLNYEDVSVFLSAADTGENNNLSIQNINSSDNVYLVFLKYSLAVLGLVLITGFIWVMYLLDWSFSLLSKNVKHWIGVTIKKTKSHNLSKQPTAKV